MNFTKSSPSIFAPFNRKNILLLFSITLFTNLSGFAQKNSITGIIRDTAENKNLHYSIAALISQSDSVLYTSVRTDESGMFTIEKIPPGKYTLMVSYPRMADYLQKLTITDTSKINLGKIDIVNKAVLLEEIIVKSGFAIRMRGDTLEYTADSFAVKEGANVAELLKRLPGIYVDRDGKITAQGKEVKKVLVDGDEFFSEDPGLVTQFLNANAVDKVQVFDKKSEQAEFTGIDDWAGTKTINLTLKKNKKNGSFGKLAAGSSGEKYYNNEAMAALFNKAKKVSVFGIASKTGKEGITTAELSKYVGQDYERIDDGTSNIISMENNTEYESEKYNGSGLPAVLNGGAHYSNKWKEGKQKLYTNYRIKQINAEGWSNNHSTTLLPDGTGFITQSDNKESSSSFMQKASGNFTTSLDSFSTIKVSVNGNISSNTSNTSRESSSKNEFFFLVNNSSNAIKRLFTGNVFGSNIRYARKFRKAARTLSFLAQQDFSEANNDNYNYANNNYFDAANGNFKKADTLDHLQKNYKLNNVFAAKLAVSERLSKELSLTLEYGWKKSVSEINFCTFKNDNGKYSSLIDTLSNNYKFILNTNIVGSSLNWSIKKINIAIGTKIYFTGFNQVNKNLKIESGRNFINLAPNFNIQFMPKQNSSFSLNYFGQTFQPSAEQLQPLYKSSNPLFVQIGNPNLLPGFNHSASVNYSKYNSSRQSSFSAAYSINYLENNISSKTTTDAQNKTTAQSINLNSVPVFYGSLYYSKQYTKIHLYPSVSLSFGSNGYNSILNNAIIKNESIYGSAAITLSYNVENKLQVSYSGYLNFSKAKSNISTNKAPSTLSHSHTTTVTKYLPKKFELVSDCAFNFQPANSTFNTSFNTIGWNASLTKKLLKNDKGFIKFTAHDILNTNTGYRRSIYGFNVSETDRSTIKRYFLLTIGWNFSKSLN